MLVPLDTLPGWPEAPSPSVLQVLGLLVGAPLLVIAVIAVLSRVHHAVKGNVGTPGVANQPIWVNGERVEPSIQSQDARDSIEAGHRAVTDRAERDAREQDERDGQDEQLGQARRAQRDDEATTGGAGARW
ncbi:hypothetical protein SAMN04488543_3162 [Friedmanniella luteola]|uniref:Uncharacterized protein n=1 Tax=Friedmanniella luteola TaxID=546871 RepID=A0A1H1Y2E1_9ACTN|nr:hypothetical protein [Friedmanniella luteola]SDT15156.1 hypothetical protein SAMN04488543_3162 [Friedmanniella luteola]